MQVVSSRNFFIDTDRDTGAGDNANIHLGSHQITAGDGQLIRLALLGFDMYNNGPYGVNQNNNKIVVAIDGSTSTISIPSKNYATIGDIATSFATEVRSAALALVQAAGSAATGVTTPAVLPATSETVNSTADRLLSFSIVFDQPHGITDFSLRCFEDDSDSYKILGGDRLSAGSTGSSLLCTVTNSTTLSIQGLYGMQRTSETHIFLRFDKPSSNIESASLSAATGPFDTHVLSSNILAMIPMSFEFHSFQTSTGEEFIALLSTRSLSTLRLFLTDSRNRPLGRVAHSGSKTATGTGQNQSVLGNLSFRAVLRIDIIQATVPRLLQTKQPVRSVNPKDTGVLTNIPY